LACEFQARAGSPLRLAEPPSTAPLPRRTAQFPLRALIPTTSATRWLPARCHLTCTLVPTLTSRHEPSAPSTRNRVLSVTW
jgi:hypothetical protein